MRASFYRWQFAVPAIGWAFAVGRIGAILAPIVIGVWWAWRCPLQQNFMAIALPALNRCDRDLADRPPALGVGTP